MMMASACHNLNMWAMDPDGGGGGGGMGPSKMMTGSALPGQVSAMQSGGYKPPGSFQDGVY